MFYWVTIERDAAIGPLLHQLRDDDDDAMAPQRRRGARLQRLWPLPQIAWRQPPTGHAQGRHPGWHHNQLLISWFHVNFTPIVQSLKTRKRKPKSNSAAAAAAAAVAAASVASSGGNNAIGSMDPSSISAALNPASHLHHHHHNGSSSSTQHSVLGGKMGSSIDCHKGSDRGAVIPNK